MGSEAVKSVDVILPVFKLDSAVVDYVVNDFLKQDIDKVVLANTGEKRLGMSSRRVVVNHELGHKRI